MKSIDVVFDGKSEESETLRKETLKKIFKLVGMDDPDFLSFFLMFQAMIKNIFDHAEGKGFLKMEKDENGLISFEVWDTGTQSYDLDKLTDPKAWSKVTSLWRLKGLDAILLYSEYLRIREFKIVTSSGFHYSGIYVPRKLREES